MTSEPMIARVAGIEQRYGKRIALHSIDLDIPGNCRVGFIGPDGVGKSSLMSLISGSRKVQKGKLEVLGGDMSDPKYRRSVYSRIAYMPQGLGKNLYMSLSVFENIDFFARLFGQERAERESRIAELMESTRLAAFKDRPAGKLSGGMKQKLGLWCALIHDPDLLILDEPTTGVDPLSRRQFWELVDRIRARRPGMGVLISTAYMDEAQSFDWLVAMDDGKILATGTPAELMSRTQTSDLDAAFIKLLPEEKRLGHKTLVVPPQTTRSDEVPAIQATGLTQRFGSFTAVDHVSFKIARGEIFGFLGSNGCGKSTTMKMLTGLLPATEGSAEMFGRPVKADDLDTRKRVGVMSQAFSLYTELTVHQNLLLHAKLFHLPADKIKGRVEEMIRQFDLGDYTDELAERLPLGVRQRLSLAVATIHKPEMLILDEPTSGVDPVARDHFWELLIQLSRRDAVTIFVSTHFMNEAMLCDRISLMHAGKVLTSDKPAKIIQDRGTKNLEDAFISYLEQAQVAQETKAAQEKTAKDARKAPKTVQDPKKAGKRSPRMLRLLGYAYREMLEILRDPIRLTFALGGTVLMMFVLGYGINQDVENISFAALDQDRTPESRDYVRNIGGSRYFSEKPQIRDEADLERRMRSGKLSIVLEIPSGYARDIKRQTQTTIAAWIDGAMPYRAQTIQGYLKGMHSQYLSRSYGKPSDGNPRLPSPTYAEPLEVRYRYNQDYKSLYSMVPATIPLLLMMIPAMLMALGIVREKELGTITNFYTTPVTKVEFMIGKQLPYVGLAMLNFFALVAMAVWLFQVPLKGSFMALMIGALLYIICSTSLGLVMSIFTDTQMAAVFGTMIATMLPATLFSGLNVPVASLEGAGRLIGKIYPTTYFMIISRGTFTKALSFADLQAPFLALAITFPVLMTIGVTFLRKQEQ